MKTAKQLKQLIGKKQHELMKLKEELDAVNTQVELPTLKEKYEGKYFKYLNSYGGDRAKWWLYSKCTNVEGTFHATISSFQVDCDGKAEFKIDDFSPISMLKHEITEEEYLTELNRLKTVFNMLYL